MPAIRFDDIRHFDEVRAALGRRLSQQSNRALPRPAVTGEAAALPVSRLDFTERRCVSGRIAVFDANLLRLGTDGANSSDTVAGAERCQRNQSDQGEICEKPTVSHGLGMECSFRARRQLNAETGCTPLIFGSKAAAKVQRTELPGARPRAETDVQSAPPRQLLHDVHASGTRHEATGASAGHR